MQAIPKFLCSVCTLSAFLTLTNCVQAQTSYFPIQPAGSVFTIAYGENDQGVITGYYTLPDQTTRGFVRAPDGTITTPALPVGSSSSFLFGVNNAGIVAGAIQQGFALHSATYNIATDTWAALPPLAGAPADIAVSINNANLIVGENIGGFDMTTGLPAHVRGYLYDGGNYSPFALPDADLAFAGTVPEDINDAGTVAGFYSPMGLNGQVRGFVRDSSGVYTTVNFPGADSTFFEGINNQGVVAGSYDIGSTAQNFLWTANRGFTLLDVPLGFNAEVWGIDNYGNVVGDYFDPQQQIGVGFGSVPEPGSVAFFAGMSLTGAAFLRRHKAISKAA